MLRRRSQLFVPGNNEKMIRKAPTLACDSVILDLEDAVPLGEKEPARLLLTRLIPEMEWGEREVCVRVNPVTSSLGQSDVRELESLERVDSLVIPKCEEELSKLGQSTGKNLIPLIETARGIMRLERVTCSEKVVAVGYGAADLASSVRGSVSSYLDSTTIKTLIVVAAGACGIQAIDNVFFDIADKDEFKRQAVHARELGYAGKQVIHPSQIELANEIFSVSAREVEWARRVVAGYEDALRSGTGAISIDGRLVDAVHYREAKRLLSDAVG